MMSKKNIHINTNIGNLQLHILDFINKGSSGEIYTSYVDNKLIIIKLCSNIKEKYVFDILLKKNIKYILPSFFISDTKFLSKYIIGYEYIKNKDLSTFLSLNSISFVQYLLILDKILVIYKYLFKNNLRYSDLKPQNILVRTISNNEIDIVLGDLSEIHEVVTGDIENESQINSFTEYDKYFITSTYVYTSDNISYEQLMSWEFLVFSILIHPLLTTEIKNKFHKLFTHEPLLDVKLNNINLDENDINLDTENFLSKDLWTIEELKIIENILPKNIFSLLQNFLFEYIQSDTINFCTNIYNQFFNK